MSLLPSTRQDPLTINLAKQTRTLLALLPPDSIYASQISLASSARDLLATLSRLLATPSLTITISYLFRPLLIDLCARWLHSQEDLEDRFVALCVLIENHEELFSILSAFLRRPCFSQGPLAFVEESLSIPALDATRLHCLLLAYYRLLRANRLLPTDLLWPTSPLSALFVTSHPDTAVRYLAIRCYALHTGMAEVERTKLETRVLGESGGADCLLTYGQNIDGSQVIIDGWLMPALELKRVHDVRDCLAAGPDFYSLEEGDVLQPLSEWDLSPWVANIHGIVMLKSSPVPSPPSEVIATPSAVDSIRKLAILTSLRFPTLVSSPSSSGKSLFLSHLASCLFPEVKDQIVTVHLADTSLDPRSLLGSYVSSPTQLGTFEWKDGVVVRAMKEGKWLVFEDIDRGSMEVLGLIKPLVESIGPGNWIGGRASIDVPNKGKVRAAERFALFATRSVSPFAYGKIPSPTFYGAHRFHEVLVDAPSPEEVRLIIGSRFPRLGGQLAHAIIQIWLDVQKLGVTASSRPVGLRELEKFCRRVEALLPSHRPMDMEVQNQDVSLTSLFPNSTFREEIFLEARDVFFGAGALTAPAQAHSDRIAALIADHLGLDVERRQWVLNGRVPSWDEEKDVNGEIVSVHVGRVRILARPSKSIFLNVPTRPFAMHKPAVCLLSRIATAISLCEPVLLTGETGTGKTSAITRLASLLHRPLVSLNLSHQTESSDLLGGFKPVDARVPASELHARFLELFGNTFSWRKNAKFEESVRKAVQEGKWKRAAALWKESVRLAKERIESKLNEETLEPAPASVEVEGPRKRRKLNQLSLQQSEEAWDKFQRDVDEFDMQHAQGQGKFAFDFVEGPLVKALRSGDWILLDEINLASSETLECITGLLSGPTASITLTEKGTLEAVPRHPDFRLFACMNPATDVGKKDLPPNIRARFTEIDVPPPDADRETLLSIIHQYIGHCAIGDKAAIMNVAEFYAAVKHLTEDRQLADGSNHRPHYSMRTLARALTFAADIAPMYGLRRALWEGCLMAFTMVLDGTSANVVTGLAHKHVLSGVRNPKSLLTREPSFPASRSADEFVKFGPFYLEKGPLPGDPMEDYIMTPSVEKKLIDLARIVLTRRFPVLIEGPTSSGKTSAVEHLARRTGHQFIRINNHEHTDIQEYIGSYVSDPVTGKLLFKDGLLVHALRHGHWIVLDELNLAPTDVLEALNRLLDDNRELVIPETQEVVRPHPHFLLFATQNPPGLYAGRKVLSRAFRNRFLEVHFQDVPQAELESILCQRCRIAPSYGQRIVSVFRELQKRRQTGRVFESKQGFATLRDLFRWAGRDAVGYQELAENGYMLLAERARRDEDKLVVKEVIETVMKVRIDERALYNLHGPEVEAYLGCPKPSSHHVVWTHAMRRLFVLVARAVRFNEPVLLVGETGSGKTSVCQLYAEVLSKHLHTLSCHQNTETADLIGGLRPVRNRGSAASGIHRDAMSLLADAGVVNVPADAQGLLTLIATLLKTNLDSSLEGSLRELQKSLLRSESLFEWHDGPLIRAMWGGDVFLLDEISLADDSVLERLNSVLEPDRTIVLAERGGIDGGYPAVRAAESFKLLATMNPGGDYGKKELSPALRNRFTEIWVPQVDDPSDLKMIVESSWTHDALKAFTTPLLQFTDWLRERVGDRSVCTLRDMLAWVAFSNAAFTPDRDEMMQPNEVFHHAAHMTFLDGLGSLPQTATYSPPVLQQIKDEAIRKLYDLVPFTESEASSHAYDPSLFAQLGPFAFPKGPENVVMHGFNLQAPTARENAMRVVRACQLHKPVLLEGSPGVGKTSLITALAKIAGYHLCRINLSDQTDLIDLFGTDLPVENGAPGEFAWKDAEFLRAMQQGHWVLLDEMNLAPQAVLEGLNAILDHRGSVYIPELGRSFTRHPSFRVFAAQNPLHQGGGRKGLPKSFLDRFTKVYVEELTPDDMLIACREQFRECEDNVLRAMITFNTRLNQEVVHRRSFGREGSPWEFNLRDIIRWGELLRASTISNHPRHFLRIVYLSRFRNLQDRAHAQAIFNEVFSTSDLPTARVPYPVISSSHIQIGHYNTTRDNVTLPHKPSDILQIHLTAIEAIGACISRSWLVVVTGHRGSGKTNLLRTIADLSGHYLDEVHISSATDTSDILGGFEQVDHLARVATIAEEAIQLSETFSRSIFSVASRYQYRYVLQHQLDSALRTPTSVLEAVSGLLAELSTIDTGDSSLDTRRQDLQSRVRKLSEVESTKGRFEWVDGPLIRAMKHGHWLVLDGANMCNPSVLDRLNSLCEPNGALVLSERGFVDGEVQILKPHPNFRLFMTVDPQYGELSRAMRNRSLEVSLLNSFTEEDRCRVLGYCRLPSGSTTDTFSHAAHEETRRGILPTGPLCSSRSWPSIAVGHDSLSSSLAVYAPIFEASGPAMLPALVHFAIRALPPSLLRIMKRYLKVSSPDGFLHSVLANTSFMDNFRALGQRLKEVSRNVGGLLDDVLVSAHTTGGTSNRLSTIIGSQSKLSHAVVEAFESVLVEVQAAAQKLFEQLLSGTSSFYTDFNTSATLLRLSGQLRQVLAHKNFDHSYAQVLSKLISKTLENHSPMHDRLASASTTLEKAISPSSGLGLVEMWSHLRPVRPTEITPMEIRLLACAPIQSEAATYLVSRREQLKILALATLPIHLEPHEATQLVHISSQAKDVSKPRHMLSTLPSIFYSESAMLRGQTLRFKGIVASCFATSFDEGSLRHMRAALLGESLNASRTLLDLLGRTTYGPLRKAIQHLTPALQCHMDGRSPLPAAVAHVGRCWIALSRVILDLFVPDIPVDPAAIIRREADYSQEQSRFLMQQIALHTQLELRTAANKTNDVISYLEARIEDSSKTQHASASIPARDSLARLQTFWSEVSQFMSQVIHHSKIDDLARLLESQDASAFNREVVIQESISGFCQRMESLYSDFDDLTCILRLAFAGLRLGLHLIRCASEQSSSQNDATELVTSLVAFPSTRSAWLLQSQSAPGANIPAAELTILKVAAAAHYGRPSGLSSSLSTIWTAYAQIYRLWSIDRARDDQKAHDLSSLYRRSTTTHDASTEAEAEEREFLELFPTFEDALHPLEVVHGQVHSKPVHQVTPDRQRQLLALHLDLMGGVGNGTTPSHIADFDALRRTVLRSYIGTHVLSLPDSVDKEALHQQLSILHAHLAVICGRSMVYPNSSNFYSDANIPEATKALNVIQSFRARLVTILEDWPDQMVLQHLMDRCDVILAFDFASPVAKFLSASEQLLVQTEDWELYANRDNSIKVHQHALTTLIVEWRRLELSCWKGLLEFQSQSFIDGVAEFWFRLYEVLVQGPLSAVDEVSEGDTGLHGYLKQLPSLLDEFMQSSSLGQFQVRLNLLQSFEVFIHHIVPQESGLQKEALRRVGHIVHSSWRYFHIFAPQLSASLSNQRRALEKEVEAFIKLASWKDINVQALKQSAQKTHHQLYKIIRKFRDVLRQPVMDKMNPLFAGDADGRCQTEQFVFGATPSLPSIALMNMGPVGGASVPAHLENLGQTFDKFHGFIDNRVRHFLMKFTAQDVEQLSTDIILTARDLENQAIPSDLPKEKREKHKKNLALRKRKAWSDLLKELKRGGLAYSIKPEVLNQLRDECWVREQPPMPENDAIVSTERGEHYFDRLRGCLPALRNVLSNHHSDLGTRDLGRGITVVESGYSLALEGRLLLSHALSDYTTLRRQGDRLHVLSDNSETVRIASGHTIEPFHNALSHAARALEELAGGMRLFSEIETSASAIPSLTERCQSLGTSALAVVLKSSLEEHKIIMEAAGFLSDLPEQLQEMSSICPQLSYIIQPTEQWIREQGSFTFLETTESSFEDATSGSADTIIDTLLITVQSMLKHCSEPDQLSDPGPKSDEPEDNYIRLGARTTSTFTALLDLSTLERQLSSSTAQLSSLTHASCQQALRRVLPFVSCFLSFARELLESLAGWTSALFKLDYVMCSVVHTLGTRGFCIPPETEEGEGAGDEQGNAKELGGTGLGEGTGNENVSKEIEDESQVEGLQGDEGDEGDGMQREKGKDEENTIEMSEDFGGEMEDVPEGDEEGDEEEEPDAEGPDEQLGGLDKSDPAAVDEKLWGDEAADDEGDGKGEDELRQERSQENQQKESDVVAKQGNGKEQTQKMDKEDKESGKEGDRDEGDETEEGVGEDVEEGNDHSPEEEVEPPNASGAPMDEYIPDANTLDLPDDVHLDQDQGKTEDPEDDLNIDEEMTNEEQGPDDKMDEDEDEDEQKPGDRASKDDPTSDELQSPEQQPPHATDDVDTDKMDESKEDAQEEEGDKSAVAQPDLTSGDGDAGMAENEPEPRDSAHGQESSALTQVQQGSGRETSREPEPSEQRPHDAADQQPHSENASASQSQPQYPGSTSEGTQRGPAYAQQPPPVQSPNPLRNLGDALKEVQQRFDEIFGPVDQSQPLPVPNRDDAEQVEYAHDNDVPEDEEMQALGPAGEEQVAKLRELKLVDDKDADAGAMDIDDLDLPDGKQDMKEAKDVAMEKLEAEKTAEHSAPDAEGAIVHTQRDGGTMRAQSPGLSDSSAPKASEDEEPDAEPETPPSEIVLAALETHASNPTPASASHLWSLYTTLTSSLSLALCESLRLILAPTLATRLRGDFRSGKRLNMRRVVGWVASEYTKDRIWMRRVKPSGREYQVLLAVDDSASMRNGGGSNSSNGGAVHLAYQTVVLVVQALGKLEVGEVGVARFGDGWELIRGFGSDATGSKDWGTSPTEGGRVLNSFTFSQSRTDVAAFLEGSLSVLEAAREKSSGASNKELWQLEIIISDGICQDHERLRRTLRKARGMRVLVVFIVIDALNNTSGSSSTTATTATDSTSSSSAQASSQAQSSILTLSQVSYRASPTTGLMELTMERYLDSFPFEYYVVLRDVEALPRVLADTLREFFGRVNEE
ncbi:P-loop containing nucleoside triphosphate hydrolase protein [Paxillus ammoniavirescens]|nr:P-loop containing nucleoside triphosphate hydrolase protein [Paxillus ammoniavirescens]